jgi:hypothetical protein
MKFRALIVVAVLAAGASFAGWTATSINVGTPSGIQLMADAGDFVVSGGTSATVVHCTPPPMPTVCTTAQSLVSPGLIGAEFDSANNCVWGIQGTNGALAGCYSGNLFNGSNVYQLRCTQSGFCGAVGDNLGAGKYFLTPAPANSTSWSAQNLVAFGNANFYGQSVLEVGGVVVSAMTGPGRLYVVVDGGAPVNTSLPAGGANDTKLFTRYAGGVGMLLTRPTTPYELYGPDVTPGDAGGWLPITVTPMGEHLSLVSYSEVAGTTNGVGFGIAGPLDGGSVPLYGPIPNPAAPGLRWEPRTAVGGEPAGGLVAVDCLTPQFCVAITNGASPNVFVYWNYAAPSGSFVAATVTEGGDASVTFTPVDPDGDPAFVTWVDGGGPIAFLPDLNADPHGMVAALLASRTPGAACSQTYGSAVVTSDGYGPNDHRWVSNGNITLLRSGPDQPIIDAPPTSFAGLGSVTLSGWTDGGCAGSYTWALTTDAGVLQAGGSTAQFTPPPYFCRPSGSATVTLTAAQAGTSLSTSTQVPIVPWGTPNTPVFLDGMNVTQDAGTSHAYLLGPDVHFCADAGGFPGVNDTWSCATDAGSTTVMPAAGVVVVASTDECSGGSVDCSVYTDVVGDDAGRLSASASLHVGLVVAGGMGGPALTFDAGFAVLNGSGGFSGDFFAGNVPCALRNGLTADVHMVNTTNGSDSGYLPPRSVPSSWPTVLFNGGGCVAADYTITSTLFGPDGGMVATDTDWHTTQSGPAEIAGGTFNSEISCVDGFSKDLFVTIPDGGCSDVFVSWTQTAGPTLVLSSSTGENVTAKPASPGLDGLVGQTATFTVFADGGAGNGSTAMVSLGLQHLFITPIHTMVPAATNADALTEVQLTIHNTEPCPVGDVMVSEALNGLEFVAMAPGAPDAGTGPLTIGPISLDANGSQTFRYLVRVPLLSVPQPTTTITVNGVNVTLNAPSPKPPDSCGCSSGSSLLLLAALSLWPRRRALWRRRTSRRSA